MSIKMVAMGIYGKNTYLADSWNRLDFFIVCAGLFEYVMHVKNLNLTAIRTIRVLRPLRAINRIPSKLAITHNIYYKIDDDFFFVAFIVFRYAYFGDAIAGHFTHAGQCLAIVLFCVFHIWHNWRTTLAGYFKAKMCFRGATLHTSAIEVSLKFY